MVDYFELGAYLLVQVIKMFSSDRLVPALLVGYRQILTFVFEMLVYRLALHALVLTFRKRRILYYEEKKMARK